MRPQPKCGLPGTRTRAGGMSEGCAGMTGGCVFGEERSKLTVGR